MNVKSMLASLLVLFSLTGIISAGHTEAQEKVVYVVPVVETVEKGLLAFLERAVGEAEEANAEAIIFDIHTPGGAVDAAGGIGKLLTSTDIKTIALVNKEAL